ncbi:MAG TPA: fibronectin type III domain-containing protein, partial [Terriglobia bacterium]
GQRFRLKATFDTSSFPPQARIVLQALKTYGMIVADNGGNWFLSGAPSPAWDDEDIDTLKRVRGSDFEAVDTSSLAPPIDNASPVGPTNLALAAVSPTQVNATWTAADDNLGVAGYRITVSGNSDLSSPLAAYAGHYIGNALSAMLTGLNASTAYYARVSAYDEAGNVSSGPTASATTLSGSGGEPSAPRDFGIASSATLQGLLPVAPGSLASLFVSATGVGGNFNAQTLPLPASLGGVSLRIGGTLNFTSGRWVYSPSGSVPARLLFVGPNQINFQAPTGIAPGDAVPAELTRVDGTKALATLRVASAAPGVFTLAMNGQGQAAVVNQDNSLNLATNPAPRGSFIQIYATGAGDTSPALTPGEAAPASGSPLVVTHAQPTVTIGGLPATVLFSGLAPGFVGLWQINARVPAVQPGPTVPLVVSIGGVAASTVTIAVQ